MDNTLEITRAEADARVEGTVHPRVTREAMEAKVVNVDYFLSGTSTIAVLVLKSGYRVTGVSGCADPRNFDVEVGKRYAYEDAIKNMWPLEGYLLAEVLLARSGG